jgi:hypothetical protein
MEVSDHHHAPAALYSRGKDPRLPIGQQAGWAPEPVWTQRLEEKYFASIGDRTPVVHSVTNHYTDGATAAVGMCKEFVFQDFSRVQFLPYFHRSS